MLSVLGDNGRTVYWIGAPVMADPAFSEHVKGVNSIFKQVADRHPNNVVYVDAYSLFSTPDGKYAPMLTVPDGKLVRVRADDGVHFTPDGGDLLAKSVFDQLNPQCKITEQAVPGVVKTTIEAAGSSSVPGTRREASTASGSTGTTSQSGPATSAPPATKSSPTTAAPPPTAPPSSEAPPTSAG
jgi:hypothetical protein